MKFAIFTILFSLLSLLSSAQTVIISDLVTLEPLAGVVIECAGIEAITTNGKGQANLATFSKQSSINFHLTGYETSTYSYAQIVAMEYEVLLFQNTIFTDEVVVSASRFEEKKADIAQQVQVISKSDLRFMNQQTTADVLQQSGNVMVQKSQQGGGSPIVRGFEANKLLLVVDGVRLNNAIYRGGHLQNVITIDNSILDKAEIVFGPGSVVYGSDALGGVIHFYTRNPLFSSDDTLLFKGNAFVRTATANQEKTGHVDFNLGGRKLASLTSISYSDYDDLRTGDLRDPLYDSFGRRFFYVERIDGIDSIIKNANPNIQIGSAFKQYDLLQKFGFKTSDTKQHILNLQYSNSSDIPRYDRLSEGTIAEPEFSEWYYGPQKRFFSSYSFISTDSTKVADNFRAVLAFQDIEESRHNRTFGSSRRSNRYEHVKVFSLNADAQKKIGSHELRYGLEAALNDVSSTANRTHVETGEITFQNTRYPDGGSSMNTYAAYATDAWEVSDKLILNGGLRASYIHLESRIDTTNFSVDVVSGLDTVPYYFLNNRDIQQTNKAINGSFGFVFKPMFDWNIAGIIATGFRAPNVDDVGKLFEQVNGSILIPSSDLKPEKSLSLDVRVDKVINKMFDLQLTGFYNRIRDLIAIDSASLDNSYAFPSNAVLADVVTNVNKDKAYIYGISGQFDTHLTKNFSINTAVNYTYGRIVGDSADTPLDHIPPLFGRTGFNWQVREFRSEFFVMYHGWKRIQDYRLNAEDNELYATAEGSPAWYTLNVRGQYQINPYLQVQVACENLLNHHYRVFASGTSGAGRNLMVTLRSRF